MTSTDTSNNSLKSQNKDNKSEPEFKSILTSKTANSWIDQAKLSPVPKMLFGALWFEHEICILFADTNLGKSILAVQIGNSISRGQQIHGFKLEALKQPILYFDFELSAKQFENRYSIDFNNHYVFDENFIRLEINSDSEIPKDQTFESYLNQSIEDSIKKTNAKVLIIDNLTYLRSETEKSKDALPLMKSLKSLKHKYGLSILVLAHTPKRDLSKPLTKNDLAGSKMLINFCDSSFTIGESFLDISLKYIKQIKARNTDIIYGSDNVIVVQIEKPANFLEFSVIEYSTEFKHLKPFTPNDRAKLQDSAIELNKQGKTQREIAIQLGISLGSVNKMIRN